MFDPIFKVRMAQTGIFVKVLSRGARLLDDTISTAAAHAVRPEIVILSLQHLYHALGACVLAPTSAMNETRRNHICVLLRLAMSSNLENQEVESQIRSLTFSELLTIIRELNILFATQQRLIASFPSSWNEETFESCVRNQLVFRSDADLLIPWMNFARLLGFTTDNCSSQVASFLKVVSQESSESSFVVVMNPSTSPSTANRAKKNLRLAAIRELCDIREYNTMLAEKASSISLLGAAHAKKEVFKGVISSQYETERNINRFLGTSTSMRESTKDESYSVFMRSLSIGLDMRLMTLAGAIVGYYVMFSRGLGNDLCVVGAAVGAILMMFVDAVLLLIQLSKEDNVVRPSRTAAEVVSNNASMVVSNNASIEKKRQ